MEIAIQAILKKQPALLSTLQTAMTKTDIQSEAKPQSILHAAINYIYDTLTPDEQNLLLCLAPLKFAINTNTLLEYSQRLQQYTVLANLPFNDWENVLEKMADWGLLRLYPDVLLQSAFANFLRSRLDEKASLLGAIEIIFDQYYDDALKIDFAIQPEMSNQNDVQMSTLKEQVIELLERLSITQFKKVLLFYKVPKSEIPPAGTQGEQNIALFEYAYQKEGEQFTNLLNVIYKVAPHLRHGNV